MNRPACSIYLLLMAVSVTQPAPSFEAETQPSKIVMLIPSEDQASLAPYLASAQLHLKDLPVRLLPLSAAHPITEEYAQTVAENENAGLIFWILKGGEGIDFFFLDRNQSRVDRRYLDKAAGEAGSVEAFALVVRAVVSVVLANTQEPQTTFNEGETVDNGSSGLDPDLSEEGGDEKTQTEPVFRTTEPLVINGDRTSISKPIEASSLPRQLKVSTHQRAFVSFGKQLILDAGYRLTIFGDGHPALHSVGIAPMIKLAPTLAIVLGYHFTFTSKIDENVKVDIKRYPAHVGVRAWFEENRMEFGTQLALCVTYVKPELRPLPSNYNESDTSGQVILSMSALAEIRIDIWKRLWPFVQFGLDIPLRYTKYQVTDETGNPLPLADAWKVHPIVAMGLSYLLIG